MDPTMASESTSLEFMRALDRDYRAASKLDERRFYSIFYSKVQPSPVMVLGYNPGGDPDKWDESVLASRSFYEGNEHEYVDCNYRLAVAMRKFLSNVLRLESMEALRSIAKTNLIFRRSRGQSALMRPSEALREASPFVERIIHRVQPKAIIFEGVTTLDRFEGLYCAKVVRGVDGPAVTSPNRLLKKGFAAGEFDF
jgi:hypothetical protein